MPCRTFQSDRGQTAWSFLSSLVSLINQFCLFYSYSPRNHKNLVNRTIYFTQVNSLKALLYSETASGLPWASSGDMPNPADPFILIITSLPAFHFLGTLCFATFSFMKLCWDRNEGQRHKMCYSRQHIYLCCNKGLQGFDSEKLSWVEIWILWPFLKSRWYPMIWELSIKCK